MRLSRLVARRGRRRRQTARCPLVCSEIAHGVSASDPASDEGAPLLLTDEALEYWTKQAFDARQTGRGNQGKSATKKEVNQPWDAKIEMPDPQSEAPF